MRAGDRLDEQRRLVYRGQFDESRPGNDLPITGRDLRAATDAVLAGEAEFLLSYRSPTGVADFLTVPGPGYVERVLADSDRSPRVLVAFERMLSHGRLAGTGYVSILPVDQGVEHSAAASFAANPRYFDPLEIVRLAVEGGCLA